LSVEPTIAGQVAEEFWLSGTRSFQLFSERPDSSVDDPLQRFEDEGASGFIPTFRWS